MKVLPVLFIIVVGALSGAFFVMWQDDEVSSITEQPTNLSRMHGSPSPSTSTMPRPSSTPIPSIKTTPKPSNQVVNLTVPFTPQAPHANWEDPYGDFCEEASVLMVAHYIKKLSIPNANYADAELHKIKDFELVKFGYHKDTTAEETAVILREFYKIDNAKTVYNPSEADLKQFLNEGKAIIIPAAGRELGNPNFRPPGPLYHMLVIKGYTEAGDFITNDPGTRNGANFIYSSDTIMNSIHDWNGGDVYSGQKVVIIAG